MRLYQREITRHIRMEVLSKMAMNGKTDHEIYEKAVGFGVTENTARSYMKQLYARGQL